jgi:uncharacterized protein (DUF2164 family)
MANRRGLELTEEQKADMTSAIKKYFKEERGEALGDLAASLVLDFVVQKLGPQFYNMGVADSARYMGERAEELLSLQK